MARTKNPTAATLKSWETRRRNQEKAAGIHVRSQDAGGSGVVQGRKDWRPDNVSGNPTGNFTRANMERLERHEDDHRNDPLEQAMVLDGKGNLLFTKTSGARDFVLFNRSETSKMNGSVLTHNHPSGNPPSADDLMLAVEMGLREIRATGPGSRGREPVLYRVGTTRPWKPEHILGLKALLDGSRAATERRIMKGELTVAQANANYPNELHEVWSVFAEMYAKDGVYYRREEKVGGK